MPNNPVQIILDDRDFCQAPEPGQPPGNRDFFEGADETFRRHKEALIAVIEAAADEIRHSPRTCRLSQGPDAVRKVLPPGGVSVLGRPSSPAWVPTPSARSTSGHRSSSWMR